MKVTSLVNRQWVQVGLVHGAVGQCASSDFPGIYGRVEDKEVHDFINETAFGPEPPVNTTDAPAKIAPDDPIVKLSLLLIRAARLGSVNLVEQMIAKGANVNQFNKEGESPLWVASSEGHTDVIRTLIDNGAKVEQGDEFGYKPLHAAAYQGHLDAVKLLIEEGK